MKRIILDHFRRWWLVLTAILIAYFAFQALSIRESNLQTYGDQIVASVYQLMINTAHNVFIFQTIMWLGFLLMWDIQRGLPRVLTSMPVTTKQIGRAWWLASVALPAIALGAIGLLALLIFSRGTNTMILLENYLMSWVLAALYLGAMFGAMTFSVTTIPNTFLDRIRTLLTTLLLVFTVFGFMFLQLETLTITKTILIFAAYAILSVVGWFRAETLFLKRAGFRLAPPTAKSRSSGRPCSEGYGGLYFLFQTTFNRMALIGLYMVVVFLVIGQFFLHSLKSSSNHPAEPIFFQFIWQLWLIMTFQIFFISLHIRFLRTLPVSTSQLSGVLIFAQLAAMLAVVFLLNLLATVIFGVSLSPAEMFSRGYFLQIALATACIPIMVWRGYDIATFALIFLIMMSFIFVPNYMKNHFSATTSGVLSLLLVCGSFIVTKLVLEKSSKTYRPRINQLAGSGWNGWNFGK